MRTTITLDDDVSEGLKEHLNRPGAKLKRVINMLLRQALDIGTKPDKIELPTFDMGIDHSVDQLGYNRLIDETLVADHLSKRER